MNVPVPVSENQDSLILKKINLNTLKNVWMNMESEWESSHNSLPWLEGHSVLKPSETNGRLGVLGRTDWRVAVIQ